MSANVPDHRDQADFVLSVDRDAQGRYEGLGCILEPGRGQNTSYTNAGSCCEASLVTWHSPDGVHSAWETFGWPFQPAPGPLMHLRCCRYRAAAGRARGAGDVLRAAQPAAAVLRALHVVPAAGDVRPRRPHRDDGRRRVWRQLRRGRQRDPKCADCQHEARCQPSCAWCIQT